MCRQTVDLLEKYNELICISSSYIEYRRNVRSDKLKPTSLTDRIRQFLNFTVEGHKSLFSPQVGESAIEVDIIRSQVKEIYRRNVFFNVYASKHPLAELSDHVLLKMKDTDFEALQKLHVKRQKFLTSFDRTPHKIGGLLLACGGLFLAWTPSVLLALIGISETGYKSFIQIIIFVCFLTLALVFGYFLLASMRTSSARSIAGEVLEYINLHGKNSNLTSRNNVVTEQSNEPVT